MRPTIGKDLAVVVEFLVKNDGQPRSLNQFEGCVEQHGADDAVRQATLGGPARSQILITAFVK